MCSLDPQGQELGIDTAGVISQLSSTIESRSSIQNELMRKVNGHIFQLEQELQASYEEIHSLRTDLEMEREAKELSMSKAESLDKVVSERVHKFDQLLGDLQLKTVKLEEIISGVLLSGSAGSRNSSVATSEVMIRLPHSVETPSEVGFGLETVENIRRPELQSSNSGSSTSASVSESSLPTRNVLRNKKSLAVRENTPTTIIATPDSKSRKGSSNFFTGIFTCASCRKAD